jgi:hypothetical protein
MGYDGEETFSQDGMRQILANRLERKPEDASARAYIWGLSGKRDFEAERVVCRMVV